MFSTTNLVIITIVNIILSGIWFTVGLPSMGAAFSVISALTCLVTLLKYLNHE